jgi:hypothetical protein
MFVFLSKKKTNKFWKVKRRSENALILYAAMMTPMLTKQSNPR